MSVVGSPQTPLWSLQHSIPMQLVSKGPLCMQKKGEFVMAIAILATLKI